MQDLGKVVVAEGVEDAQTLELLAGIGCDKIQGYFISRPLDVVDSFDQTINGDASTADEDTKTAWNNFKTEVDKLNAKL